MGNRIDAGERAPVTRGLAIAGEGTASAKLVIGAIHSSFRLSDSRYRYARPVGCRLPDRR
jgi:hypothetical protein